MLFVTPLCYAMLHPLIALAPGLSHRFHLLLVASKRLGPSVLPLPYCYWLHYPQTLDAVNTWKTVKQIRFMNLGNASTILGDIMNV